MSRRVRSVLATTRISRRAGGIRVVASTLRTRRGRNITHLAFLRRRHRSASQNAEGPSWTALGTAGRLAGNSRRRAAARVTTVDGKVRTHRTRGSKILYRAERKVDHPHRWRCPFDPWTKRPKFSKRAGFGRKNSTPRRIIIEDGGNVLMCFILLKGRDLQQFFRLSTDIPDCTYVAAGSRYGRWHLPRPLAVGKFDYGSRVHPALPIRLSYANPGRGAS